MSAAGVTVDLVRALAWPSVVACGLVALRNELKALVRDRLVRVETPLGTAEFERTKVDVEAAQSFVRSSIGQTATDDEDNRSIDLLIELAAESPRQAIIRGFDQLEAAIREAMKRANINLAETTDWSVTRLATTATAAGAISEQSREAIQGLVVLRNLALRRPDRPVSPSEAVDYVALVEGTIYSLRSPGPPPASA